MKSFAALLFAFGLALPAAASPGAHGPNGEHLDGPGAAPGGGAAPRIETFTEAFELVGRLSGGELSVLVDRYETNEPVLNGKLEVQYKNMKANAQFHADAGDYAIDDPALVRALSVPGKHALLFTLVAGDESDLLEGTLEVPAKADHEHEHGQRWPVWLAGAAAAAAAAIAVLAVRRRRVRGK